MVYFLLEFKSFHFQDFHTISALTDFQNPKHFKFYVFQSYKYFRDFQSLKH